MTRALIIILTLSAALAHGQGVVIGSKKFTESYVLGEVVKQTARKEGLDIQHKQGMGGTVILWQALVSSEISAYPEYTGTIAEEILKRKDISGISEINSLLAEFGVAVTEPLGFNNTYALAMHRGKAAQLGIKSISDLRRHPRLVYGLSHEFLGREDGWIPLAKEYMLEVTDLRGIDHALAYTALASGSIDVIDVYSTDAKISEYDLYVLQDDKAFFPRYDAVFLYNAKSDPKLIKIMNSIVGTLPDSLMIHLNAEAERTHDYSKAASLYFGTTPESTSDSLTTRTLARILRHLELVLLSLLLAVVVGIPFGILATKNRALGTVIIGGTSVIQTIPSLALLALLVAVPSLGISSLTAIIALFLYSLLPIVRSTATGLVSIPRPIRESAEALGLSPSVQMRKIYLPLASRSILSGIKTSAVINVGTATLAALIGAGGLGEPIISGLNLNDTATILEGAIPAAILALFVEFLFIGFDRIFIPRGLRLETKQEGV